MKQITLSHNLSLAYDHVLFSQSDFNAPNSVLISMQKALTPQAEIYMSINNNYETDAFMLENTLIETIRANEVDGFIVDQIFTRDYHDVNEALLSTLSNEIRNCHFIIGPAFTKVPYFLHSRLAEVFIDNDVSGIIYDLREIDLSDFKALQPLAKLKMHVKKRISIIPLIKAEQLEALKKSIPFDVCVIDEM
ncbi:MULTISPECIES: hypothetical protein [Jeotgalicoccus]|uniref:hypothetical protein n=1 Tax=Jeotgalicoccus TaxID=227979 RepID=UPI00047E8ABC|nr:MULTISPECIES: hypothetical protein [Jeotgalicoccus]QQD85242.1 hypothetical protein JEM45_01015 [Jeotgalicoccus sp. ATCC 8456]